MAGAASSTRLGETTTLAHAGEASRHYEPGRMRLASARDGSRDGRLLVVRRDGEAALDAAHVARSLQDALDRWEEVFPSLRALSATLDAGDVDGIPLDPGALAAPLPRAYEWIDGSAFLSHVRLVRRARGAEPPADLEDVPLLYQGGSGVLLGPTDDVPLPDPALGLDFEGEVCCILGDVPSGTRASEGARHVRLLCLANDLTFRNLVPAELARGFGFFQSKPATAFSPFAVTPDELGPAWRDGRVHLPLTVRWNGRVVGTADAGGMHFSFFQLLEHAARTRSFTAGTILGSGTVSSEDPARGWSCIAEARARELVDIERAQTRFLAPGDTVEMDMRAGDGRDLFGRIAQRIVPAEGA
jgi:fumarylacetoacetate (FAA) hydrolase